MKIINGDKADRKCTKSANKAKIEWMRRKHESFRNSNRSSEREDQLRNRNTIIISGQTNCGSVHSTVTT